MTDVCMATASLIHHRLLNGDSPCRTAADLIISGYRAELDRLDSLTLLLR
jgi:hypothetical protein